MFSRKTAIDNLTFVSEMTDDIKHFLETSTYIKYMGYSRNYGFGHSYQGKNGEFLESSTKKFRFEFNPRKADCEKMKEILFLLNTFHITRLDVGIDYEGINLSRFDWSSSKIRKKQIWYNGYDGIETIYIGAPSSDIRFVIFDKISEQLSKGEEIHEDENPIQWRVKSQRRFKIDPQEQTIDELLPIDLFDVFPHEKTLDLDLSVISDTKERIMVRGMLNDLGEMKNLSPKTRIKYNKLIRQIRMNSNPLENLQPSEIYLQEREELKEDLRYFDLKELIK